MTPLYPLLGLLVQGERYGYELKRIVDQDYAPFWRIDYAQLYRSLARLARERWVQVRTVVGQGPDRKLYRITARGRQAFVDWLDKPAADRDERLVKARLASACGISIPAALADRPPGLIETRDRARANLQSARQAGDAGALIFADAALRDAQAALASLELAQALFPGVKRAAAPLPPLLISGSDDPLLTQLARFSHASAEVVGSLGGLLALARGQADVAGIHLLDVDTGEYNLPFVKHLLPEDHVVLVNLALRENGLMLAHGNPKGIRSVRDLTLKGVRLINRPRGTGTRLLLAARLRAAGIDPHSLGDWDRTAATHAGVAGAICTGAADVGPGLRAVAEEWGLDFIPLGEERFDLAMLREAFDSRRLVPLRQALHGQAVQQAASGLKGYDLSHSGQVVARV